MQRWCNNHQRFMYFILKKRIINPWGRAVLPALWCMWINNSVLCNRPFDVWLRLKVHVAHSSFYSFLSFVFIFACSLGMFVFRTGIANDESCNLTMGKCSCQDPKNPCGWRLGKWSICVIGKKFTFPSQLEFAWRRPKTNPLVVMSVKGYKKNI